MRISLKLKTNSAEVPINYYYPLSSAIYRLLHLGSPEFSAFMHNIGYKLNGKSYKLFCFAIRFENFRIADNKILLDSPFANLIISSPIIEKFIKSFVAGTFQDARVVIKAEGISADFSVEQMEAYPEPKFGNTVKFKLLSPLVLSNRKEFNGKNVQHYLRYYDDINEINRIFNKNLINKFELINGRKYSGDDIKFTWDYNYINNRISANKKITKLISIKNGRTRPVNIVGNLAPFTLSGSAELIKTGYDSGFGEKNSMGFGLVDIA